MNTLSEEDDDGVRCAFRAAVEDLYWDIAGEFVADLGPVLLTSLERQPGFESALIHALAVGPVGLTSKLQLFSDVSATRKKLHPADWRDECLTAICGANSGWAAIAMFRGQFGRCAHHIGRAFAVPLVSGEQERIVTQLFSALIRLTEEAEARLGSGVLRDLTMLDVGVQVGDAYKNAFGSPAGPGTWISIALESCAASSHYSAAFADAVREILRRLSWPTLRELRWLGDVQHDVLPTSTDGLSPMAARWISMVRKPKA